VADVWNHPAGRIDPQGQVTTMIAGVLPVAQRPAAGPAGTPD
jgi:hypothetical protein